MITFEIREKPVSAPRPRVTNWGTYYKPEYVHFKQDISRAAKIAMKGKERCEDELTMVIICKFAPPETWSKKAKKDAIENRWKKSKPDIDNLTKGIMDGCTGIVWKDDSQVVALSAFKYYAEENSVTVYVMKNGEIPRPSFVSSEIEKFVERIVGGAPNE